MIENIMLTFVESKKLCSALADRSRLDTIYGDGMVFPLRKALKMRGQYPADLVVLDMMVNEKKQHRYFSFETWFGFMALNLCQTRIIPDDKGCVFITMGDGWTPEVHANVIKVLRILGIFIDTSDAAYPQPIDYSKIQFNH